MYIEQYLIKERHQERLKQAEEAQIGRQIAQHRKLEKRRRHAERQLVRAWRRVEQLQSIMSGD